MTSSRRRPFFLSAAAVVLLAAAGCSSTDAPASITVPSASPEEAALCRALHEELPDSVAGMDRKDPEPASELTAGWGDAAIVLRCGVPRPEKMNDPEADGVTVGGVDYLLEQQDDGSFRFTTTYRKAYVEVTLTKKYASDVTPLIPLGAPIKKTVPASL
ncbi:DUF3515 domain-containing protein [Streptomyces sp. NBC_01142]|uniref:DUF3515 domain-containing protein n=1 Tax=Streptomyces sp. NBC_01142 TaxID=2975865 RepID=UPI002259430B|nr:DUF3515 domain-containing protein [Streptomyces sp. NBC_01142]MCX4819622.1 DUF3515 domain-containing protein [Streptomyces sp. NBC_01142]